MDPDSELPPHLVPLFLRSATTQLTELADACKRRDSKRARAVAHKLKGSLYAAGASRLADDLEVLRAAAAAGEWGAVDAQLPRVRSDLTSVMQQLEAAQAPGT
jgi:HPt (histidine-containing phosphotransfer) domain-containing protein